VDPAGQADGLAGVGQAQRAAGVGTVGVHFWKRQKDPFSRARKGAREGADVKAGGNSPP
jgi:hypothetical protein